MMSGMSDATEYMRGESTPDRFQVLVSVEVLVTDWEKLRDKQLAMQRDEQGNETLSVPPLRHPNNVASVVNSRIWTGDNSGAEGFRILGSSNLFRFPDADGGYPALPLPEL